MPVGAQSIPSMAPGADMRNHNGEWTLGFLLPLKGSRSAPRLSKLFLLCQPMNYGHRPPEAAERTGSRSKTRSVMSAYSRRIQDSVHTTWQSTPTKGLHQDANRRRVLQHTCSAQRRTFTSKRAIVSHFRSCAQSTGAAEPTTRFETTWEPASARAVSVNAPALPQVSAAELYRGASNLEPLPACTSVLHAARAGVSTC